MAAAYGFRIYVVQAFANKKKDQPPQDVVQDGWARDHVLELLDRIYAAGNHYIEPSAPASPGKPAKPTVVVAVDEPVVVRQDLVHVLVSVGEEGAHRLATERGNADVDLTKKAAHTDFWITLAFPTAEEAPAMMVVSQTVRRRDGLGQLLRLLTEYSSQNKKDLKAAEDRERARIEAAGERPPRREAFDRLLFDKRQASDSAYLDEIITRSKRASVRFEQKVPNDRGRGVVSRRRLTIDLFDEDERGISKVVSRAWTRRQRGGERTSHEEGRDELAAALEEQDLIETAEVGVYTEASINVVGENEVPTTIAVDTLREVFTYPISDGRPSVLHYYEKVADRLEVVAAEEGIEIASLSATEVEQCLDGSM